MPCLQTVRLVRLEVLADEHLKFSFMKALRRSLSSSGYTVLYFVLSTPLFADEHNL